MSNVNLKFQVYRGSELMAATRYAEDAAMCIASGTGNRVRYGDQVVWREGQEIITAAESYDKASDIMNNRASDAIEGADRTEPAHG